LVNSPGPDDAGGAVEGAGVGVHRAGSGAAGFAFAELKMRVNSPGAEFGAEFGAELGPALAPEPCREAAGIFEIGATGMLGGSALGIGALCVGALDPAAGALPASGAFIARNIAVKLPGSLPPAGADAGGAIGIGSARFSGVTAGNAGGV
jgi:hypothetical protein